MERLHIVMNDQTVLDARTAWQNRQHKMRWKEFASEAAYQGYRNDVKRTLFKQWLTVADGEFSPALIASTPTGLLIDLYPNVLQYGPQAEMWAAWNRELAQVFNDMNKASGKERMNFVMGFITMYSSRITVLDPQIETLVYDRYREVGNTDEHFKALCTAAATFFQRTLAGNSTLMNRLGQAYRAGSELILLSDLFQECDKRRGWHKSLRLHRGFMRKAQAQIRDLT